jgi:hypothetical protein
MTVTEQQFAMVTNDSRAEGQPLSSLTGRHVGSCVSRFRIQHGGCVDVCSYMIPTLRLMLLSVSVPTHEVS